MLLLQTKILTQEFNSLKHLIVDITQLSYVMQSVAAVNSFIIIYLYIRPSPVS
jgi:hypothetical protein